MATDPLSLPWRTGRHVPRHIYAQIDAQPSGEDVYLGALGTPELAAEACAGHNERLAVNPAVGLANAIIRARLTAGASAAPTR
jgi:hypothetical protein